MRATFPRAIVLATLLEIDACEEVTPQDLYMTIERRYGNVIPVVACYRILGDLEKAGFLQHRYQVREGRASIVYRRALQPASADRVCFLCPNCLDRKTVSQQASIDRIVEIAQRLGFHAQKEMVIHALCDKCHAPAPRLR